MDWILIWNSLPNLLYGAGVSLQIAGTAAIFGICLGTVLGVAETSPYRAVKVIVWGYVTVVRGTPMLVQILFFYYVLPQLGVMITPFWAACAAIGFNSSAYVSQIVITGMNGVSQGQIEAAHTLGFGRLMTLRYVVLPQAFKMAFPALGNELITLIKDSSLASIIGVMELSKEASIIRSRTYDAFSILLATSVIYLILTATVAFVVKKLAVKESKQGMENLENIDVGS